MCCSCYYVNSSNTLQFNCLLGQFLFSISWATSLFFVPWSLLVMSAHSGGTAVVFTWVKIGKEWGSIIIHTYMLQFPGLLPCKLIIFLTVDWVGLLVHNYAWTTCYTCTIGRCSSRFTTLKIWYNSPNRLKKKSVEKNNNIAYWCGALLEGYVPVLHVLCHVEHNSKPVVLESRV